MSNNLNSNSIYQGDVEMRSIGIVGTGWVGSTYAKNFQARGFKTVCYSLEPAFIDNKDAVKACDVVIVAVPTPTTSTGADYGILRDVLNLIGKGKIAVIKSTILPGTTDMLQKENPQIIIIHSPEFLSVVSADHDAANPKRNVFGLPLLNDEHKKAVELLQTIFPSAPYTTVCTAVEAEIIKYSHNIGGYIRIVFHNLLYDICLNTGSEWETVKNAMAADPNSITAYLNPVHKNGRGAGGPCFIKDFAAFRQFYETISDHLGSEMLESIERKNISLLKKSGKDLEALQFL